MLGPDTPGTFTPRTPAKGFLGDLLEGFVHMQALGEDVIEAFLACIRGHRMTEDLAARCIQTYQRRFMSVANFQENRGAAITIQVCARLTAPAELMELLHILSCELRFCTA